VGWRLYSSRFLVNIGIIADFSLEISSLCSVHHFYMVWSVFCSALRMAAVEGPCSIIMMSSANTTFLTFGAMESSAIRSLMTMLHKVGPETDPCGEPLLTQCKLSNITWAVRSLRKSRTKLYIFGRQLRFHSWARIPGCQALSKAPAMSSTRRQHFCPILLQ
jgi:hypothetical protein